MFVQAVVVVDACYEDLEALVAGGGEALFGEALGAVRAEDDHFTAKVGPRGWPPSLGKSVELRLGPVRRHGACTLVAFSWEARGGGALFPPLDADLELTPGGVDQTVLTVRGIYRPPGGVPGRVADELVLHRIAESTVHAFLDALCARLRARLAQRTRGSG